MKRIDARCIIIDNTIFMARIPNKRVFREFLVNKGKFYCMPAKDLTNDFLRVYFLNYQLIIYLEIFER